MSNICHLAHNNKERKEKIPTSMQHHQRNTKQHPDTLSYYARYREWDKVLKHLLLNPSSALSSVYPFTNETALHYAAKYAKNDVVGALLKIGTSVHARDVQGLV